MLNHGLPAATPVTLAVQAASSRQFRGDKSGISDVKVVRSDGKLAGATRQAIFESLFVPKNGAKRALKGPEVIRS
jgi:hypothetical protein